MIVKTQEREAAIILRRQGLSLREIREQIPVAKSTLSLWLREVGLSRPQKQRLTQKKLEAARRGALKRKLERIESTERIYSMAEKDITVINKKELLLMGVMLYWAEGQKQKPYRPTHCVRFSNSDPRMLRLFTHWLKEICNISDESIRWDIYIHETAKRSKEELIEYWSVKAGLQKDRFGSIYLKRAKVKKVFRKNIDATYFGLVSIKVYRSTNLNRRIEGWVRAVEKCYWGVV